MGGFNDSHCGVRDWPMKEWSLVKLPIYMSYHGTAVRFPSGLILN